MPRRNKVLTTTFSMKRAKARRHTGPARPGHYVGAGTGFAKRNLRAETTKFPGIRAHAPGIRGSRPGRLRRRREAHKRHWATGDNSLENFTKFISRQVQLSSSEAISRPAIAIPFRSIESNRRGLTQCIR